MDAFVEDMHTNIGLIKRRIKDILMKNNFNCGKDCVIILREAIKSLNYRDIENALNKEMRKL